MAGENTEKGITIVFRGDTIQFDKSINNMNKMLGLLQKENNQLKKSLEYDPTNLDKLKDRADNFRKSIKLANDELEAYQKISDKAKATAKDGILSDEALKDFTDAEKHIADLKILLDKLTKGLDTTQASIDGLIEYQKQLRRESISGYLEDLSERASKVAIGFNAMSNAMKPLSSFATKTLKDATKSAMDFETSIVGVEKVLNTEGSYYTIDDITEQIKNMAKEVPADLTEIANAFALAAQTGVNTNDLEEYVKVMLQLGSATNIDSVEATQTIAQLFNVIGEKTTNIDKFASALVELGNTSATTEKDILEMASSLGASASNVGIDAKGILALADALASAGMEAGSAGSSISRMLTAIDKSLTKAKGKSQYSAWAKMLDMYDVTLKQMWDNDALGTFNYIIKKLNEASNAGENLNAILGSLGVTNIRDDKTLKALINSYPMLEQAIRTSTKAWEDGTSAEQEASKAWDTLNSKMAILKNNMDLLKITLGNELIPIIAPLVEKVAELVTGFASMSDKAKRIMLVTLGVVSVLSPLFKFISGIAGIISQLALYLANAEWFLNFVVGIESIGGALASLGGWLIPVVAGVIAFGVAIVDNIKNNEKLREKLERLGTTLKNVVVPLFKALVTTLGFVWNVVKAVGTMIWDFLYPIVYNVVGFIMSVVVDTLYGIASVIEFIIDLVGLFIDGLRDSGALDAINKFFDKIVNGVQKAINWWRELLGLQDKYNPDLGGGGSTSGGVALRKPNLDNQPNALASYGIGMASGFGMGNTLSLATTINVTNNGTPIDESEIRRWGETITDVVSKNLSRRV